MADKKISQLTAASAVSSTDLTVVVSGSATYKATFAQIAARIAAELSTIGIAGSLSIAGGAITPAATFTRSGTAYLDGVSYATNVPRFPSNSGIRGVLVEEGLTPLNLWSDALDNAYWLKLNATVTANAATAPDGTSTADLVLDDATNAGHAVYKALVPVGQPGTAVAFAKRKDLDYVYLSLSGGGASNTAWFNVATGIKGSKGVNILDYGMTAIGDGWYFIWASHASVASTTVLAGVSSADNVTSYVGSGLGNYFWRLNVIQKAYALTPHKVEGSAATRNAETLTVPTAGLLTPSAGSVILLDFTLTKPTILAGTFNNLWRVHIDANNYYSLLIQGFSGRSFSEIRSGGTASSTALTTASPVLQMGVRTRVLLRLQGGQAAYFVNGQKVDEVPFTEPVGALPASMYFGSTQAGAGHSGMVLHNAVLGPALSDAAAIAATLGNLPSDFTAYYDWTQGVLAPDEFAVDGRITAEHGLVVKSGVVALPAASISELALPASAQLNSEPYDLPSYTKTTLPAHRAGRQVYVTDVTGGAEVCYSDGAAWRRSSDRTVVS